MTKKEVISKIAAQTGISQKAAEQAFQITLKYLSSNFHEGKNVIVKGVGAFHVNRPIAAKGQMAIEGIGLVQRVVEGDEKLKRHQRAARLGQGRGVIVKKPVTTLISFTTSEHFKSLKGRSFGSGTDDTGPMKK